MYWRKRQLLKRALSTAGKLGTALDLPCGDGRFWSVFEESGVATLTAAEVSKGMMDVAVGHQPRSNFPAQLILTSAFDIDLGDDAIDFVACLDFYQHLSGPEDQLQVLSELGRVARSYVAISATTDSRHKDQFAKSGFEVLCAYDLFPMLSKWRLYLLRKPL